MAVTLMGLKAPSVAPPGPFIGEIPSCLPACLKPSFFLPTCLLACLPALKE